MSPIKRIPIIIIAILGLMMLAACGTSTSNKNTTFDAEKGTHSADWLPQKHCLAARADLNSCKECHGDNLDGGLAGVNCMQCHLGSPVSVHPLSWQDNSTTPLGVVKHRWYVIKYGTISCANINCHGSGLRGVD